MQRYLVVVEKANDNYSAYSPDLPGCVATGDTREEAEANMREAIRFHLEGHREDPWQVLGVPRDAPLETVRARWRELVRAHHPDKVIARGLPPETVNLANARIAAINRAWEEISARLAPAA